MHEHLDHSEKRGLKTLYCTKLTLKHEKIVVRYSNRKKNNRAKYSNILALEQLKQVSILR